MAETLIFHYRQKNTFLHRCNPITKFLSVIILCLVLLRVSFFGVLVLSTLLFVGAMLQKLPLRQYKRELRFFVFMLFLILLTEYLAKGSFQEAFSAFFRFFSIILLGLLISDSTAPDELGRSLGNILDKIPFVNGAMVASSIELTLSLLPMIFDASLEVHTARQSRLEKKRNPFVVITSLSSSIFDLLLDKAQNLSDALEARLFDPSSKRQSMRYKTVDVYLLLIVLLLSILAFVL
ncbi:MAG: energy-coupling factor transporter transmembrane protein EcfT [Spirochaetia bacterium]|nr:energy-coupling factor transporter transmembrane protein EcfT [Spirochaetia bacterium]